jgi:hypothetical protein
MSGAPEGTLYDYGLCNGAPVQNFTITDAFGYPGYTVKLGSTAKIMVGTTGPLDVPDGYTVRSSVPATAQIIVNMTEGSAVASQEIGVQALIPGQTAYIQLAGASTAISIDDFMQCAATAGTIQPRSAAAVAIKAAAGVVFCKSMEAKDASATGALKVRIISAIYCPATVVPT